MRDGASRAAASIIAAMLAVMLALAVHFLASADTENLRSPGHARILHLQEAEASFAPDTLSRP